MKKKLCIKCAFLILFIGLFALASQLFIEYERWGKARFDVMFITFFEPARAAAIFVLSIFLGLFLRMPVTGDQKKDSLLSGGALAVLTLVQIILFFTMGPAQFFIFSHNLFTMWCPIVFVCAGVALGGRLVRGKS